MKSPTVEQIVAVVLLLLNALVFVEARRLWGAVGKQGLGPGEYLALLGSLLLFCNLFYIGSELVRRNKGQRAAKVFGRESTRAAVAIALMAGQVLLTPVAGFLVATAVFFGLFFRLLSGYSVIKSMLLAFGLAILLHLTFVVAFQVPLPTLSLAG